MLLFIDTADIKEIKTAADWGVVDGVTTNPSLIAKSGRDFKEVVHEICQIIDGPISAEVVSSQVDDMVKEGRILAKIHDNIVVKLPLTPEGLKACRILSAEEIATNVTLCFQVSQAFLAAKCGATYISPFSGRRVDGSANGAQLIKDIRKLYDNYGYETQILAASIRHPQHVVDSALAGADVCTLPLKILAQLYQHPLTDKGLEIFNADWKKSNQKSII